MFRLIETIRICDGQINNLPYHQYRMQHAMNDLASRAKAPDLESALLKRDFPNQGLLKCRVVYDTEIRAIEIETYQPRTVDTLKLVEDDDISYAHKFADRTALQILFERREKYDEVLIVKNGKITDTSYANVIFRTADRWVTPTDYLLAGTQRQFLLDTGKITEEAITPAQLKNYSGFKLINAMLLADGPEIAIKNIY